MIAGIAVVWTVVALLVGVLIGRGVKLADQRESRP